MPTDRTTATCFIRAARRGKCSHTWMPGTVVATGLKGPRYSAGASGFMSHVSMCDAPPESQNKITDLALPPVAGEAARLAGKPRAGKPMPAWRNIRRLRIGRNLSCESRMFPFSSSIRGRTRADTARCQEKIFG